MKWKSILAIGLAAFLPNTMVSAEILEVDAVGEYTAGKNETMLAAEEFARQEAHRIAIEKVGIYLESHTEMIDQQITKDEVRAVAAAILKIPEETYDQEFVGNGGFRVTCRIHAVIDTEKVDIAAIASDKKDLKDRTGRMNELNQMEKENRVLKEKLEKYESDIELQNQFIKNQRKFLIKSYDNFLLQSLGNISESNMLATIDKMREVDPSDYRADYWSFDFHRKHGDEQKTLEFAKQCIRKIRKNYSPKQIKRTLNFVVVDLRLVAYRDVDTDELFEFGDVYDYLKKYLNIGSYVRAVTSTSGMLDRESVDDFLVQTRIDLNELDCDISEIYSASEILFRDYYFEEEV